MWLHLWLQGMMIVHMNNPVAPYTLEYCENQRAGLYRGIQEEASRSGGLITIAGVKHPAHHIVLTCNMTKFPEGTIVLPKK